MELSKAIIIQGAQRAVIMIPRVSRSLHCIASRISLVQHSHANTDFHISMPGIAHERFQSAFCFGKKLRTECGNKCVFISILAAADAI